MARIRSLKPEFWTDGIIVQLSMAARLFYQGTWNFACDRGHLPDDPVGLKLKILPADDVDAEALIAELIEHGRIERRVTADGRPFLYVKRLPDHQKLDARWQSRCPYCAAETAPPDPVPPPRDTPPGPAAPPESPPKLPETPASHDETPRTSAQEGIGGEGIGEEKASPSKPRKRGKRIPDDFRVTPDMVDWARERCPHVDGRVETEKFINYWRAKSGRDATKLDWVATWRNWMLNAAERAPRAPNRAAARSTTDDRVAQAQALKAELAGDPPPPNSIRGELT